MAEPGARHPSVWVESFALFYELMPPVVLAVGEVLCFCDATDCPVWLGCGRHSADRLRQWIWNGRVWVVRRDGRWRVPRILRPVRQRQIGSGCWKGARRS